MTDAKAQGGEQKYAVLLKPSLGTVTPLIVY